MRSKISFIILACSVSFGFILIVFAKQDPNQEEVRGSFLTTRKNAAEDVSGISADSGNKRPISNKNAPPSKPKPKPKPRNTNSNTGATSSSGTANTNSSSTGSTGTGSTIKQFAPSAIGLGYTLYMRDAKGEAVRVDPSTVFHSGDRIRIGLEANTDGYLYVFHTENDGAPEMIFPDARLADGNNAIDSHVPYEIPSSQEKDERFRWFVFDQTAATEKIYVVVTREALPTVPINEALVKLCATGGGACPWKPTTSMWGVVAEALKAFVGESTDRQFGAAQTKKESDATTRGLGLDRSAPAPSVVRMNASSSSGILVTTIALTHK